MDMAVAESSLLSLPDEILSMIMAFTMASEEPVKLRLFLDLNRDFNDQQDCHKRSPPGFRFSSPSRLDLLPLDQKEHYLDWLVVNGTCNRIRRVGKSAFFREKSFMIHESLFHALRANKVTNMTASDLALAKTCIRHVVSQISWRIIAKSALFDHLQSISVYKSRYGYGADRKSCYERHLVPVWGLK
ncbi:MAG: hypothetical protein Q9199_004698 [Rusavskia elegans]